MKYGYDLSGWDTSTPDLTGIDFVIARASVGLSKDAMYDTHEANTRKAGKDFGAYHFITVGVSGAASAGILLASAKNADFLAVDVEAGATDEQGAEMIATLQAHDSRFILRYASLSRQVKQSQDGDWTAAWGSVSPNALIWQRWSPDDKTIPRPDNCPGNYDFNVFQGSDARYASMINQLPVTQGAEVMGNLFPITTHRVATLVPTTVLYRDLACTQIYQTISKTVKLGLIEAYSTVYKVADGDYTVFVKRSAVPATSITVQDQNNGV